MEWIAHNKRVYFFLDNEQKKQSISKYKISRAFEEKSIINIEEVKR